VPPSPSRWLLLLFAFATALPAAWKFGFGPDAPNPGFTKVEPGTIYDDARGFGFEPGANFHSIDLPSDPLRGEASSSAAPFFFSVHLPDGNYRVTVTFGGESDFIAPDFPGFDPAHPDAPEDFAISPSPLVTNLRPPGDKNVH